jgi:hypothetical protein
MIHYIHTIRRTMTMSKRSYERVTDGDHNAVETLIMILLVKAKVV